MSKLYLLCLIFFCTSALVIAQPTEQLKPLQSYPGIEKPTQAIRQKRALSLPFIDDFSENTSVPNPNKWADRQVFINRTHARKPITLGVATFDGIDEDGRAYDLNRLNTDTTDILTSLEIDLSNAQDTVVLSFYYQAGGYAEPPSSQDSLTLEFWNSSTQSWDYVWAVYGGTLTPFKKVMVAVDSVYHTGDFRFRFLSFGAPAGAFDVWHLDYVELDEGRSLADTILRDIAYTLPHPSLLNEYEALPWFHVNTAINPAALAKRDIRLAYRRNVDTSLARPTLFLGEYTISLNGSIIDQNGAPDGDLDDSHPPNEQVLFPVPDTADAGRPRLNFLQPPYSDEFTLRSVQTYSGGPGGRSTNDTLIKDQHFKNYYAYDDGSAERGYEILNNQGGFIVQRYDVVGSDSLRGLYLYFLPAFYDIAQNDFTIVVLDNDNGRPGQIIYESDSVYQPVYSDRNFYQPYLLDSLKPGVLLTSTVFVGIRQSRNVPLTLGYDLNRGKVSEVFYGRVGDMYQSFSPGVLMIRPFLRYLPRDLSRPEDKTTAWRFQCYPNPTQDRLYLEWPERDKGQRAVYQIFDLQGSLLLEGQAAPSIAVGQLPSGLYLLRLRDTNGHTAVQKIRIR